MILQTIEQVKQDEDDEFFELSQDARWQLAKTGVSCLHSIPDYNNSLCRV